MDTQKAVSALGALAQETRLAIFRLLVQRGPAGVSAGLIGETLGVPPSSLSFHLAQLAHAGLLNQRRVSRNLIYAADFGTMNALMSYLTENCCGSAATCAAACAPGIAPAEEGERDEAPARARRR